MSNLMRNQSQIYLHINPGGAQLNTVLISISWESQTCLQYIIVSLHTYY